MREKFNCPECGSDEVVPIIRYEGPEVPWYTCCLCLHQSARAEDFKEVM